jgi:hypothetical protein
MPTVTSLGSNGKTWDYYLHVTRRGTHTRVRWNHLARERVTDTFLYIINSDMYIIYLSICFAIPINNYFENLTNNCRSLLQQRIKANRYDLRFNGLSLRAVGTLEFVQNTVMCSYRHIHLYLYRYVLVHVLLIARKTSE